MTPRHAFHVDPRNAQGAQDELSVQVEFRRKMRMEAPRVILVAVPNAGRRSLWEARQRKREGMTKGFPDLIALVDGRAAFLEFKSGTGALSEAQIDTCNQLVRESFPVGVFRSADSAVAWLRGHWPDIFIAEAA